MKDQVVKSFSNIKEFWGNITPEKKKLIYVAASLVLAASIAVTAFMNLSASRKIPLFPRLSAAETTTVCSVLTNMGVEAEINSGGEILVPADQQGELQVQLAGKGYPKSAPTYDLYLGNTGFTRTESEKKQIYLMQLQERIQATLMQSKGVKNAVAILAIPEDSGYVWDQKQSQGSASLSITMEEGYELTGERVSAFRNLVAFSVVPQMDPQNVKVIDATTGIEILPEMVQNSSGLDIKRLDYERRVQKNIEDNIKRLLTPVYGPDGVTVAAWVTLDYDKMLTEQHQVVPQDNGNGVKNHEEESYTLSGETTVDKIVGEENNTDTPSYPSQTDGDNGKVTSYDRFTDWENSYINTQIEKGEAILKEASVSVLVNDPNFSQQKQDDLVELVSKSVNIKEDSISVKNYQISGGVLATDTQPERGMSKTVMWAAGLALLMLIFIIILIVVMRRDAKKRKQQTEDMAKVELDSQQAEIDRLKAQLSERAKENDKDSAIINEVRDFARENPEATANLIRSMLKEDE